MNCSYRILKNVNIGASVRKTSDKNTVPFNNEPMTGMKIESWNKQGFILSHPDLPEVPYHQNKKEVWLDFEQLPLNQLNIEMGIIKNPLTFVESIVGRGGTSMVLIRADTFDYLELVDDKKAKDEATKYKPTDLKIGDQVISCLCREGNVMIYMGKFVPVKFKRPYGYSYSNSERRAYIESAPERYYFAYPQPDGTYTIKDYPLTNKTVVELYMASDKGKKIEETRFNDYDTNYRMIMHNLFNKTDYQKKHKCTDYLYLEDEDPTNAFDFINKPNYGNHQIAYVGTSKEGILDKAVEFYKTLGTRYNEVLFKTVQEYYDWNSKQRNY
jgi:hypothetical protein